jgi:septum site-determining protein MinC
MGDENVVFRGTREGVTITLKKSASIETIKQAIQDKLNRSRDFFRHGRLFVDFADAGIGDVQQESIKQSIMEEFNVIVENTGKTRGRIFSGIYEGRTRFISSTIRSGQDVDFPGNIVIIGDVNAGGKVKAEGNIIVLGSLRGVAHGGSSGNQKAIIAAYSLQPTQLRIADIISRAPDGELLKPKCPELARIKDGCIFIEPYIPNKNY